MEHCRTKRGNQSVFALLIAGAVLLAAPISSMAAHLGGGAGHVGSSRKAEDVRNTLHNLSLSNPVSGVNISTGTSSTTEVCAFCHTPHGANIGTPAAPLWNRAVPASSGYTLYSGPNFDGTVAQPVGVSLACLSCHDGVTGLDSLINMPGSGGFKGYTPSSAGLIGEGATSDFLGAGNVMSGTLRDTSGGTNYQAMTGARPFPNLTTDLSDDHPISFAMGSADPQFEEIYSTGVNTPAGNVLLIARAGTVSPADRRDAIRLYPAGGGSTLPGSAAAGWVECASCHNPHAPRPLFLRLPNHTAAIEKGGGLTTATAVGGGGGSLVIADNPNVGSAVCISCHEK